MWNNVMSYQYPNYNSGFNYSYYNPSYTGYNNGDYNYNQYSYNSQYSYQYQYQYQYPQNTYNYNQSYNQYPYNTYSNNYSNYSYNSYPNYNQYQYPNNYYSYSPAPSYSSYTVTHICGPNSTYDPAGNDCDCYSGYISQNNICVIQPVTYGYNNYNYGNNGALGFLKPVAVCNDGTVSYSPVGTCWINGGVRNWTS
jgi:hypothetical protein